MRIATLIIGLLVGLLLFIQSFTMGIFSYSTVVDDTTATAGGAGLFMALLWLLACALVIPFPLVSTGLFAVSIPIGLFTPTGEFEDLRFHGFAAIVLTVMAFFGWRGKRKAENQQRLEQAQRAEHDERVEALLRQQVEAQHRAPCPSCNHLNGANARFCGNCRAAMAPT